MKGRRLFVSLVLGLSLTAALLWVFGSQKPPVVAAPSAPTSGVDWDGLRIGVPTVISDAGTYRMWYQGKGLAFYGRGSALGYAESPDGATWTKYAGNPVLEAGDPGAWDGSYRGQPALLADGGLYKMWYSGADWIGSWQTGYATSTDGLEWVIYAGNPVLTAGGPGSWDEMEAEGPTVIKDGATYKMWYHGCNADYSVCSIGYATSPDGVTWTKYGGNPVLQQTAGQWDESGLSWPRVVSNGVTYEMWYHSNGQLGRATSPDGVNWTKDAGNPVLSEGWDGGGVGGSSIVLDGGIYRMWTSSGDGATRGIGYLESADGIAWTQPVSNPVLVPGETGMIIHALYIGGGEGVEVRTLANTPVTITVSDSEGVKATISGVTDGNGDYRSNAHNEDWVPPDPDILPGDTVSATADGTTAIIETVGEIDVQIWPETDLVEGTIDAPWFSPDSLSVLCWTYDPYQADLDTDVAADGGNFECDFSGLVDIVGGMGGQTGYLEPDGDMVSVEWTAPYMEVFYGTRDGVGGIYAPGYTFWITVTNPAGGVKATAMVTSELDGGWWGHGFTPTWAGGTCCDWSPAEPDIQPGDWVYFQSDDGYENRVRAGTIFGAVDVDADSVTGPIYAGWLTQTLGVWCHPQTMYPPEYRDSSAEPDGSMSYFCEWQNPAGGQIAWDIQPADEVMVHYREPDGDQVYRMMVASEGALYVVFLPLVVR